MKNRRSVKQIRHHIYNERLKTMREFNEFDGNTPIAVRIRNTERLQALTDIGKFVGGIREIRYKVCILVGCDTPIADIGTGQKYCSGACRAKAYRERKKRSEGSLPRRKKAVNYS